MRQVTAIAEAVVREAPQRAAQAVPVADPLPTLSPEARRAVEELVNRLFRAVRVNRPAWRQAWNTTEVLEAAKLEWVKAFVENGISDWDRQVEVGLRRLRAEKSDFVPSPGKFIGWCNPQPEDFGLPEVDAAYAEACRKAHPTRRQAVKWSHEAVYRAATDVGLDNLMQLARQDSLRLFERSYAVMCRRLIAGESLGDGVALAIGHDSQKSTTQLIEEHCEQEARLIRERQGIPQDGKEAYRALMASRRRMATGEVARG